MGNWTQKWKIKISLKCKSETYQTWKIVISQKWTIQISQKSKMETSHGKLKVWKMETSYGKLKYAKNGKLKSLRNGKLKSLRNEKIEISQKIRNQSENSPTLTLRNWSAWKPQHAYMQLQHTEYKLLKEDLIQTFRKYQFQLDYQLMPMTWKTLESYFFAPRIWALRSLTCLTDLLYKRKMRQGKKSMRLLEALIEAFIRSPTCREDHSTNNNVFYVQRS